MTNSTNRRSAAKPPSSIQVLHQQARAAKGAMLSMPAYAGEPPDQPDGPKNQTEVERQTTRLEHAISELYLALDQLDQRLAPVLPVKRPELVRVATHDETDSPLGGALLASAQQVEAASTRVASLLQAIRL